MALPAKRQATEAFLATLTPPPQGGWTAPARQAAFARFSEEGVPVRRDEYWRFSNPAPLLAAPPALALADEESAFAKLDRARMVFRGGAFVPGESDAPEADGVEILARAGAADIHWARDLFGALETRGQDPVKRPLAALNTALASDGVLIRATGTAPRPVEIVYRADAQSGEAFLHHVVRLDPGATLILLETGTAAARVNTVLEVELGEGASFHHVRTQHGDGKQAATHVFARLGPGAQFRSFTLSAGGQMLRNESVIELAGDGGLAHVAGVTMAGQGTLNDDTVFITHDATHCESRQVFRKVLRAGATGVFQGKILVKEDAQQTDGYQISQALLIDDSAAFLAKPELEIYADDVQCSHGSTSGAIDETALYYLRSRGIPRREAEHLLVEAFLTETLAEIVEEDLAEAVQVKLQEWLVEQE